MDDTFVVIKTAHNNEFLEHINSIDKGIQFTAEKTRADGSMPSLDSLVTPQPAGSLNTTVYRKLPILINICIGIATKPFQQNIVSLVHCIIGPRLYILPHSIYKKKKNIYKNVLSVCSILCGP